MNCYAIIKKYLKTMITKEVYQYKRGVRGMYEITIIDETETGNIEAIKELVEKSFPKLKVSDIIKIKEV
jgi:hypothetical protein